MPAISFSFRLHAFERVTRRRTDRHSIVSETEMPRRIQNPRNGQMRTATVFPALIFLAEDFIQHIMYKDARRRREGLMMMMMSRPVHNETSFLSSEMPQIKD